MEKTFVIIDGHALAYRSFYAFISRPLVTSKGFNTSALFGFTNYLLKLYALYPDSLFAVTFDSKGPSFRQDIYSEYKANRLAMPEDLRAQITRVYELAEVMGFPCFAKPGLEADDLIGTFADYGRSQGWNVRIVSKDKDLMQLVDSRVHLVSPENGGGFKEFGPQEVFEKMGVMPDRIVDLLALMGDSSDNIPGVPGVGPKTAIKILQSCDSVEKLLADPSLAGTAKLSDKISSSLEKLELSYRLVQLKDVDDIAVDIDLFKMRPVEKSRAQMLLDEFEFPTLKRHPYFLKEDREEILFQTPEDEVKPEFSGFVKIVQTDEDLGQLLKKLSEAPLFSLDTETTSLECRDAEIVGISIAFSQEGGWYIPLGHDRGEQLSLDEALQKLKPLLEDNSKKVVGQNLKYDYQIFLNYGITLGNISFDTMLAAYVLDSNGRRFSMDELASQYLNRSVIPISDLIGSGKNQRKFSSVEIADAAPYAVEDVVIPLMLMEIFEKKLDERGLTHLFENIEMPLVPVIAQMEYNGCHIDSDQLSLMAAEYSKKIATLEERIFESVGEVFNLNSPKQLASILFDKLALPAGKKTKTGYSTNVSVLENLSKDYEIVADILLYREKKKLLSTYILALPQKVNRKTGRIHTSFNQTGTATGRLSSTEPNLQNIPIRTDEGRRIRSAFTAGEGRLILSADYSQIELRLLAHFSDDPILIDAFNNDLDIHRQTAAVVEGIMPELVTESMRRAAKSVNFGLMYGMGAYKLSQELGIGVGAAKKFIDNYFERFATIKDFMDSAVDKARSCGYSETLFGRVREIRDINSANKTIREAAERLAVNTPVQGTAADIIKKAMINISKRLSSEFNSSLMLLQVHDELVFDVSEEECEALEEMVVHEMSTVCKLSVPLKVSASFAKDWSGAH